jgi:hypothetical protein|tara:strand:+ start:90 stop:293 length:204 start_codon:yes stop_codon:yes gene_type:complete
MISVGDDVVCNWGAMHPQEDRIIERIEGERLWLDGGFTMLISDLREMGGDYHSPIGVYQTTEKGYSV